MFFNIDIVINIFMAFNFYVIVKQLLWSPFSKIFVITFDAMTRFRFFFEYTTQKN